MIITELGLLDLIVIRTLDVLVDARMQKYVVKPDLRRLARSTIGLGPGFASGNNCDIAVETRPGKEGSSSLKAQPMPPTACRVGSARQLASGSPAPRPMAAGTPPSRSEHGCSRTSSSAISAVRPCRAPFDGILRGVVRDGTEVPAGAKLLEIDPRGRSASATTVDSRIKTIARAVMQTLALREFGVPEQSRPPVPSGQVMSDAHDGWGVTMASRLHFFQRDFECDQPNRSRKPCNAV